MQAAAVHAARLVRALLPAGVGVLLLTHSPHRQPPSAGWGGNEAPLYPCPYAYPYAYPYPCSRPEEAQRGAQLAGIDARSERRLQQLRALGGALRALGGGGGVRAGGTVGAVGAAGACGGVGPAPRRAQLAEHGARGGAAEPVDLERGMGRYREV